MNLINAIIDISPTRLNFPLATFHARLLHSFSARLIHIPDDVTSLVVRVFKTNGTEYYDLPASRHGGNDSTGVCYIVGTCFPAVGSAKYEVHGYDQRGNMTALGAGLVEIENFTTTAQPISPGQSIPIDTIRDASGLVHTITAVPNSSGEYTTQID